jgi:hypothetical protein
MMARHFLEPHLQQLQLQQVINRVTNETDVSGVVRLKPSAERQRRDFVVVVVVSGCNPIAIAAKQQQQVSVTANRQQIKATVTALKELPPTFLPFHLVIIVQRQPSATTTTISISDSSDNDSSKYRC